MKDGMRGVKEDGVSDDFLSENIIFMEFIRLHFCYKGQHKKNFGNY